MYMFVRIHIRGLIAILALLFVSCSQDEILELNRSNDIIQYGVVANASSRAARVYGNNNLPGSFKVWALHDEKTYIDGDVIAKSGDPVVWNNTTATRYWPAGNVDFYAYVNDGGKFAWNSAAPTIEDYTVSTDIAEQYDLLYAVKQQNRTVGTSVNLNFRHALSQILFQARNTNSDLCVVIDGVTVCNVADKATFTFPLAGPDATQGGWPTLTGGDTDYPVTFTEAVLNGVTGNVSLTSANDDGKEYNSNALLLLPQSIGAWDVKPGNGNPANQTGTYFLVRCAIYQIGKDVDGNDVPLWLLGGKSGDDYVTEEVAIPVKLNWEQGKKYIYTFIFGEGNGGYNPTPDGADPDPVLVPISFSTSIDDFVDIPSDVPIVPEEPVTLPELTFVSEKIDHNKLAAGETIVIDGNDYDDNVHLRLYSDNFPINPNEALKSEGIEANGKLVVQNFKSGAISVKVAFTTVEIKDNQVESIDVGGTNLNVIVKNNVINGEHRDHWRHDISSASQAKSNSHGFYLYSPQYNLVFDSNVIKNTAGVPFRIHGWGIDGNDPNVKWGHTTPLDLNTISSFKNNSFEASYNGQSVIQTIGDCSHYAYDKDIPREDVDPYDGTFTPDAISVKATEFMNMVNAPENNNIFTKAAGVTTAYRYKICTLNNLTWNGIKYDEY
jgi:hypothetical protein